MGLDVEVALFSSALFARRFLNARPLPLPGPDILEHENFPFQKKMGPLSLMTTQ